MTYKLVETVIVATVFWALAGPTGTAQSNDKLTYQGPIERIDDDNYLVDPDTTISVDITSAPTSFSVSQFFGYFSNFNTLASLGEWTDGGRIDNREIRFRGPKIIDRSGLKLETTWAPNGLGPHTITDIDWHWAYNPVSSHPGTILLSRKNENGVPMRADITLTSDMIETGFGKHEDQHYRFSVMVERLAGRLDSGDDVVGSNVSMSYLPPTAGTYDSGIPLGQFPGIYEVQLRDFGVVLDSARIEVPPPVPYEQEEYWLETTPRPIDDGFERSISVTGSLRDGGEISVNINRVRRSGTAPDQVPSVEDRAVILTPWQLEASRACVSRLEDVTEWYDAYTGLQTLDGWRPSGQDGLTTTLSMHQDDSRVVDLSGFPAGRYTVALLGERDDNVADTNGTPILATTTFDIPVRSKQGILSAEVLAAPENYSDDSQVRVRLLDHDIEGVPNRGYIETVRPAFRSINGALMPEFILASAPISLDDGPVTLSTIAASDVFVRFRSTEELCDQGSGDCGYIVYAETPLNLGPFVPVPETLIAPLRVDSAQQDISQTWPRRTLTRPLCGEEVEPADIPSAYKPPAVIAVAAKLSEPEEKTAPSYIGIRAQNTGETGAADLSLGIQLFAALDAQTLTNLKSLTPACRRTGEEFFQCSVGDLAASDYIDLFFETTVPPSGQIAWRTVVESSGDLGQPRIAEGLLGEPREMILEAALPVFDQMRVVDGAPSFPYPFSGKNESADVRYILAVGANLPTTRGDTLFSQGDDVTYHFAATSNTSDPLYYPIIAKGWARFYGMTDPMAAIARAKSQGREAILIDARLQSPALPGKRTLAFNGVKSDWMLKYGDLRVDLQFARDVTGFGTELISSAYAPERVRLLAQVSQTVALDTLPAEISHFSATANGIVQKPVTLAKAPDLGVGFYQSDPIDLYWEGGTPSLDGGDGLAVAPDPAGPEIISAVLNEDFAKKSLLIDRGRTMASLNIARTPVGADYNYSWSSALSRAAKCNRISGHTFAELVNEESDELWNLIVLTDADFYQELSVKFGHHAAAILLREKFLDLNETRTRQLEWTRDRPDALASMAAGLVSARFDDPTNPFLRQPVTDINGVELELRDAFIGSDDAISERTGKSLKNVKAWRVNAMRQAVDAMIAASKASREHAIEMGDCEVKDLLYLTGFSFEPIRDHLVPELMKLDTSVTANGQRHQIWVPDRLARRWVAQVAPFADAVKAQEDFANLDTGVLSMAFAVATMPLGFVEAGGGLIYYSLVGAQVLELGFTTVQEINNIIASRKELAFADGAALLIGDARYNQAEANAQSWVTGAITISLSLIGLKNDIGDVVKSLRVGRGRTIAANMESVEDVLRLTPDEQRDFVSFATSAHVRRTSSGPKSLDELELRTTEMVDNAPRVRTPLEIPEGFPTSSPTNGRYGFKPNDDIVFDSANMQARPEIQDIFDATENGFTSRVVDNKLKFEDAAGNPDELAVGKRLGMGATSETFVNPLNTKTVIRVTYVREGAAARKLDEFGYNVLDGQVSSEHIRAAKILKEIPVRDGDSIAKISIVERVDDTARGLISDQAAGLLKAASDGQLTAPTRTVDMRIAQIEAYTQALEDLNRRGFVWLDNKGDNFGFVPLEDGSGRFQVVVFDTGGIVPIRPDVAAFRNLSTEQLAREMQYNVNGPYAKIVRPRDADIVRPDARSIYRKEQIVLKYGDAIDLERLELTNVEQVWFNPWAGEEFAYLANMFDEVYPNAAARLAAQTEARRVE